jgi:hypothetical protein
MKTIFTLLASLILSMAALAGPGDKYAKVKSMLTIRSAERGDIRVVIDGRRFEPNRNYMRINSMQPGHHRIQVYRERNSGGFNIFGKRYEKVFSGAINLRARTSVMLTIDRFGRAIVNEYRMNGNGNGNHGWGYDRDDRNSRDNRDYGDRTREYDRDNNRSYNDDEWGEVDWNRDNDFDFDRDGRSGDYDGREFSNSNRAMGDLEFSRVLQSIQKEWYDNTKAKSAEQIINTNFFTSAQVKQMLQLFTFEENKLDLAKKAYGKTVDQRNYLIINDVFSFNNSKEELARYIRSFR